MAMIYGNGRVSRPVIDLRGPQGNAFYLLGTAKSFSEHTGKNWPAIEKEMMSKDYINLISVLEREFGDIVDIILPDGGIAGLAGETLQ